MTALWFESQKEIQEGKLKRSDFLNSINDFILKIIDNEKSLNKKIVSNEEKEKITCPKCQKRFFKRNKWKIWKMLFLF